jgi:hypothetical protein
MFIVVLANWLADWRDVVPLWVLPHRVRCRSRDRLEHFRIGDWFLVGLPW